MKPRKDFTRCLLCTFPATARGLCARHYGRAYKAVKEGGSSWRKLEKAGQALPRGKK